MTVLTTVYTAAGGIKAVIWTDLLQTLVMLGGALAALAYLCPRIPVPAADLIRSAPVIELGHGLRDILASNYTLWAGIIASTFTTLATHGTDQDMVQRMLTARDYRQGRLSLVLSGLAEIPVAFVFLTVGLGLAAYYGAHPDPGLPARSNEVFAYFILSALPTGLRGLLIAGVFSTAMGSLSAAINALATSFTRDWYLPWLERASGRAPTETVSLRAARLSTVLFAALLVLVATLASAFVIWNPETRILPLALGVFGYTYGSVLGVFLLGSLTRTRGNDRGNRAAMAAGLIAVAGLSAGGVIAFPWRILVGSLTTFSIGALFRTPRTQPK
jgi:Na+/proline symporter